MSATKQTLLFVTAISVFCLLLALVLDRYAASIERVTSNGRTLTFGERDASRDAILNFRGKEFNDRGGFTAQHVEDLDLEFTDVNGKKWVATWKEK